MLIFSRMAFCALTRLSLSSPVVVDIAAVRQISNPQSMIRREARTTQARHTESLDLQRHLFWSLLEDMKTRLRNFWAGGHLTAVRIEWAAAYKHGEVLAPHVLTQPGDL